MKYKCKIVEVKEDDEITILIDNTNITGFSNCGVLFGAGVETEVNIELFDNLVFSKSNAEIPYITRQGESLSYVIVGILHVDEMKIESVIDFDLEPEDLYDYGFLDGRMVQVEVLRMDFDFVETQYGTI